MLIRCHIPEIRPVMSRWARWSVARTTRTHLLFEGIQSFGWRYLLAILLVRLSPATNSPLNACSPSYCRVFLHVSRTHSSTTLIKKFPEFIQKIQNISFIHQKWYCPLQSTPLPPSTATHLCQRLIQFSKHFWNSIVSIAIRAVFDFSITSFRLLKRVPRNDFLTRSNRKKSQFPNISKIFSHHWIHF